MRETTCVAARRGDARRLRQLPRKRDRVELAPEPHRARSRPRPISISAWVPPAVGGPAARCRASARSTRRSATFLFLDRARHGRRDGAATLPSMTRAFRLVELARRHRWTTNIRGAAVSGDGGRRWGRHLALNGRNPRRRPPNGWCATTPSTARARYRGLAADVRAGGQLLPGVRRRGTWPNWARS